MVNGTKTTTYSHPNFNIITYEIFTEVYDPDVIMPVGPYIYTIITKK